MDLGLIALGVALAQSWILNVALWRRLGSPREPVLIKAPTPPLSVVRAGRDAEQVMAMMTPPVDLESRKHISDEPVDDAYWNEWRGEPDPELKAIP